jgi:hypothetical protein
MATKERIERPAQIVKPVIKAISSDLKTKAANAFETFVNKLKDKHLS